MEMNRNEKYRTEMDSLGEIAVPFDALYGAQTQRAIENFQISGMKPYPAFTKAVTLIKKAAAVVNLELGLLDLAISRSIQTAADEVLCGKWQDQFAVDPFQAGAGTSHNMNVNEVLANRANQILGEKRVHPNDHVNMSQSTNDVIPTAIRIGCLQESAAMREALDGLSQALEIKAREFDGVVKSGRTHLQDAAPVRLGQEFGAYARAISLDCQRISQAESFLKEIGIGGTAVGSGLNAHPDYHVKMTALLSELINIQLTPSDNLFERMQSMADLANYSATLRGAALTLIRIANDLRLLSSGPGTGLDEIRLPALQPGSSIMPGKINPVMPEMLNMAMFHVIGCDTTVAMATQAGQLELNVMMPIIAHNLFESMIIMTGSVNAFTNKCVKGICANPQKAARWLENNPIIVTALNPLIGYQKGAELVKRSVSENRPISEVAFEAARSGELFHLNDHTPVTGDEILNAFSDTRKMTDGGIIN